MCVVLVVADHLGAGREPRLADQHRHVSWGRDQCFYRKTLRLHGPFLGQLATERKGRILACINGSARSERPDARPRRDPLRAPAGQPAALAVAHDAEHRQRAGRVLAQQPQRPAHLLELELELAINNGEALQASGQTIVCG